MESQLLSRTKIFIPPELIVQIGQHATLDTLASMCRANTQWNSFLTSVLYKEGVKASETHSTSQNPAWLALLNYQVLTFRKCLQHGLCVTKNSWCFCPHKCTKETTFEWNRSTIFEIRGPLMSPPPSCSVNARCHRTLPLRK